jgi:hypothetical protein
VHHQVQELLDLGLKTEGFRGSDFAHDFDFLDSTTEAHIIVETSDC